MSFPTGTPAKGDLTSMYVTSLAIVVSGVLVYHAAQKKLPQDVAPFAVLAIAYSVALLLTVTLWRLTDAPQRLGTEVPSSRWGIGGWRPVILPAAIIGGGAFLVELGFVLMYRSGWMVSNASLSANVIAALLLVPLGTLLFHESMSPAQITGLILGALGLYLISRR